jgi:hypothetical protein
MALPITERLSRAGSLDARADEQVEQLVADIAGIIRTAEPAERAELKDLAESLLHDELSTIAEAATPAEAQGRPYRFNPLAPGILIVLLGLGFFLIFPLVGLTLAAIGAVLMISGGVMSWLKK